jgi:clorobiocin biosynthesis protein CloN6
MSPKTKRNVSKGSGQKYQVTQETRADGPPVLFIHPTKQGLRFRSDPKMGRPYGLLPVGLPALVNVLRQNGIQVKGIDQSLEIQINPSFNISNWLMSQRGVKVILIDLHWYEHCFGAIDIAQAGKRTHPDAWVVLGGLSASGFARDILESFPEVDVIVRGDAEKPLLEMVQHLLAATDRPTALSGLSQIPNLTYSTPEGVVENELGYTASTEDLDQLDYVDLSFLEHSREYLVHEYVVTDLGMARQALNTDPFLGRWVTTARGCKYECAYCGGCKSAHKLLAGRNGIVSRSPEIVVDELVRLQEMGVHQASLAYDIAELGEAYWSKFFQLYNEKDAHIGLYNEFFQMPSVEFVHAYMECADMKHSCVTLSPLSGNERVRRLNGKHFSNSQLFDMLALLSQYPSYLIVYFSLNLPGETNETFQETLALATDIYHYYPNSHLKILNSVHTIDPLSPMNVRAERYGVESSMKSFMDFYNYCKDTRFQSAESRNGLHRGFELVDPGARSLQWMADTWDAARQGKENSWWPIPPSW